MMFGECDSYCTLMIGLLEGEATCSVTYLHLLLWYTLIGRLKCLSAHHDCLIDSGPIV